MNLGAGGLTGRGGWNDADAYFHVLPDDHTDFIFSVVGGRWGFFGCLFVLALYGVILLFGAEISKEALFSDNQAYCEQYREIFKANFNDIRIYWR